jgi:8-oxo-dGTP pyrophosphatase MutT (NUDIX family)
LTGPARTGTTAAMSLSVVPIDHLEFAYKPRPWAFADARRAEIDAHFAERNAGAQQLWNGRVLLASDYRIQGRSLVGSCFETDFASFLAWRDWGCPDATVTNCFAMGALRSADGAFLLGVMGAHTANAGLVYFPAGTPDPNDLVGDRVDLAGSIAREVAEETGITAEDYTADPAWSAVPAGPRLALMKVLAARMPALELQRRVRYYLARDKDPELADIRVVRSAADFDQKMPPFVTAFLAQCFR